jgi:hypothetical protein
MELKGKEEGAPITTACLGCYMLYLGDMFRLKLKALIEQYENALRERENMHSA